MGIFARYPIDSQNLIQTEKNSQYLMDVLSELVIQVSTVETKRKLPVSGFSIKWRPCGESY
jgi:hypothetical protein